MYSVAILAVRPEGLGDFYQERIHFICSNKTISHQLTIGIIIDDSDDIELESDILVQINKFGEGYDDPLISIAVLLGLIVPFQGTFNLWEESSEEFQRKQPTPQDNKAHVIVHNGVQYESFWKAFWLRKSLSKSRGKNE